MEIPSFGVRMEGVRTRKRKMVEGLIQLRLTKYKESGAELIMGEGRFVGPEDIRGGIQRRC